MVVIQTLFTNLTLLCHICWRVWCVHQLWHMTVFRLFCVSRDGCHMWVRKYSLFLEHLISLHLRISWFHSFIINILLNLSDIWLCLLNWLMTLVCLLGLVWLFCLGLIFIMCVSMYMDPTLHCTWLHVRTRTCREPAATHHDYIIAHRSIMKSKMTDNIKSTLH